MVFDIYRKLIMKIALIIGKVKGNKEIQWILLLIFIIVFAILLLEFPIAVIPYGLLGYLALRYWQSRLSGENP